MGSPALDLDEGRSPPAQRDHANLAMPVLGALAPELSESPPPFENTELAVFWTTNTPPHPHTQQNNKINSSSASRLSQARTSFGTGAARRPPPRNHAAEPPDAMALGGCGPLDPLSSEHCEPPPPLGTRFSDRRRPTNICSSGLWGPWAGPDPSIGCVHTFLLRLTDPHPLNWRHMVKRTRNDIDRVSLWVLVRKMILIRRSGAEELAEQKHPSPGTCAC